MRLPLPPLAEQQKIVSQITALEAKIAAAKQIMTECPERKREGEAKAAAARCAPLSIRQGRGIIEARRCRE